MRILSWVCDHTRKDRMHDDYIQEKYGVGPN